MRDVKRIGEILNELSILWGNVPDWRFFQLLQNIGFQPGTDYFYLEDDKLLEILKETNKKMNA